MLIHNFLTFADHRVCEMLGEEDEARESRGDLQNKSSKLLWRTLLRFRG